MSERSEEEGPSATSSCPACGKAAAPGAGFCTHCGEPLDVPRPRRARRTGGDAAERARSRHEFGRVKSVVLTVRSVFLAGVVYAIVLVALAHTVDAKALGGLGAGARTAVFVLVYGNLVLTSAGALLVLRAPLVWTVVGACYWTLDAALNLWLGDFALPPGLLVKMFLTVAFWFAVGQAARVERLMAADPTLQIVRKRIRPEQRVAGGVAEQARGRLRADRRRALLGRLRLGGIVVLALVGLGFAVRALTAPPTADAVLARFTEHWQQRDVDAIAAMFDGGAESVAARDWLEAAARRGWRAGLPATGEATNEVRDDRAVLQFALADGAMRAGFARLGQSWRLQRLELPPLVAPDVVPAIEQFRQAWAARGSDALLAMLRPESRDRLGSATVRLLERHQWGEQRPALGDFTAGPVRQGRAKVFMVLGDDEISVGFEYWHPRWWLASLTLPRQ